MRKAFTLIELMIVITIIAILTSILLFGVSLAQKKRMEIKALDIVQIITKGLEVFNNDNGTYPPDTHNISFSGVDPDKGLHSMNCDSLIRYLSPKLARAKGYKDPKTLGTEDYVNIPEEFLTQKLSGKWVVVDPWKRPLIYDNNSDETGGKPHYIFNINSYDLHSAGANGKDELGKGDDIPPVK